MESWSRIAVAVKYGNGSWNMPTEFGAVSLGYVIGSRT